MREVDVPNWLKELPLAPVFYPTDTEFADPIAYISKIEKEASAFGICRVVPPLPKPSKKYVTANLNKSLLKCPELGTDAKLNNVVKDGEIRAVFTTRHQELGHNSGKRTKESGSGAGAGLGLGSGSGSGQPAVNKQVWQSGEIYTLDQFESKSKTFARSQLGMVKDVSPLAVESLFWKAACEKPIYVEYANDVPGSGFGEPVGTARFSHKHRRRRRRTFDGYDKVSSAVNEQQDMCSSSSSVYMLKKDSGSLNDLSDSVHEIEGSAGWKLSNCPWNLQVIARSPGSLTRFMPDDIPGVTSPMVYIGMLFSWFAWHVEDHELHSLNFLHLGSPKTWYAIPGDYAFTFEEVIRSKAYGEGIDRLAALTLLGEKTTLLSPETVVASGIPCCRLVQNPGEFVVTFPRAYHIGFSHGFNCGEAANFATPKWLSVAKEAAVRRAAMNFLPMLSHQQLLYLLTMSFIPRVPRSLLPGIRSSRSKNRQKEERELLVKKAFIDDILNENRLLNYILQKNSSYRAVLWDIESLSPSVRKETNIENVHLENDKNLGTETLVHIEDDDMSSDFRIDSGTLPCVACGVLGYPFMSVIQPSTKMTVDGATVMGHGVVHANTVETELVNVDKGRSTCEPYLRPRIFCLEHVSKIEELLHSTGGAKLLIICHSDFQKIKVQASTIAEQIGSTFGYTEVRVDDPTRDDLDLINLAIDNEQEEKSVEDWTTKLNVNIRQSVKLGQKLSADKIHSTLAMDALFADPNPDSTVGSCAMFIKWQASKSRSNRKPNRSIKKSSKTVSLEQKLEYKERLKEETLIQYSRRIFKSKPHGPITNMSTVEKPDLEQVVEDTEAHTSVEVEGGDESRAATVESYGIEKEVEEANSRNENSLMNDSLGHANENGSVQEGSVLTKVDGSSADEPVTDSDVRVEKGKISDVNDENTPVSSSTSGSKKRREVELSEEKSAFSDEPVTDSDVRVEKGKISDVNDENTPVSSSTSGSKKRREVELSEEKSAFSDEPVTDSDVRVEKGKISDVNDESTPVSSSTSGSKKRRAVELSEEKSAFSGFIKSPCEGLRPRAGKDTRKEAIFINTKTHPDKPAKKSKVSEKPAKISEKTERGSHKCDREGCKMRFTTKSELTLHRKNVCPHEGCGKKFRSHRYAVLHVRVHEDNRPLKCTWKGCKMTFKWAWALTEHIRVHTGERPYKCKVEGCGLTFRFVSDFSRHRRKTGHNNVNVKS